MLRTTVKTVNPFPYTTYLQQTTLNKSRNNYGKSLIIKVELLKRVKHCGKRMMSNFSFFRLCFQRSSAAEASESVCMRERVKTVFSK